MKTILAMARDLHKDESGASFIEYTVLLGVILAVSVTVINGLGTSASGIWTKLTTDVNAIINP
jgi:Flp pilus assembly pilin Flp